MTFTPTKSDRIVEKISKNLWKSKYPKKHDHYTLEDFSFRYQQGDITDWNESRNVLVTEDFIVGLIEGLEEEVGSASSVVMYNIGKAWGVRDAEFLKNGFKKNTNTLKISMT